MFPDYYKLLDLTKNATRAEIKKAYRKLALEFHPDRNKTPDAHDKFISINEAYLILFDLEARDKYDSEYNNYYNSENTKIHCTFESSFQKRKEKEATNTRESQFEDADLNDWSKKAKQQGADYARMAYDDFSKMVIGFVKETGFQLGNTSSYFILSLSSKRAAFVFAIFSFAIITRLFLSLNY
jgi:curved DNA-binding protein CbpA